MDLLEIFSFEPQTANNIEHGREPNIKNLLFQYYIPHMSYTEANKCVDKYITALQKEFNK